MSPSLTDQIEAPPRFTECVSEKNEAADTPADSRQLGKKLQELIEQIQRQSNPATRALLQECLQSLLAFYGDGLSRMLRHAQASTEGQTVVDRFLKDGVISSLLLIHGLHPLSLETRLRRALETVRPYMQSHGGNLELLGLEGDVARIRLQGTCKTCPSSAITLELAVRRAVEEACPDLAGFEVLAETEQPPSVRPT